MHSSFRITSTKCILGRIPSIRQIASLSNDPKSWMVNPALTSSGLVDVHKSLFTTSTKGPLLQKESVKTQLKEVSNVDTPERIRQAWFHPDFPVEKMTDLLVSLV